MAAWDEDTQYQEYDFDEDIIASEFVSNIVSNAEQYVDKWFADKDVDMEEMHDPKRISMVMNTDICTAVENAYGKLEALMVEPAELEKASRLGLITADIELVHSILQQLATARIPKEYAGGLLLLHLEVCHGVKF